MEYELCKSCTNREFSNKSGIICSLTKEKPNYLSQCSSYNRNDSEYLARQLELKTIDERQKSESTGGLSAIGIKNPILAGIIITLVFIILNVILLIGFQRISLWLIALLIFGIIILINGIISKSKREIKNDNILDKF